MAGANSEKPSGLSTRGAVLAGVGIVITMGLAIFYVAAGVPFLKMRKIVHENPGPGFAHLEPEEEREIIDRLGG